MSEHEAKFNCVWCRDTIELNDKDVNDRFFNDTLGSCPKCGKFSYCNSITAKYKINTKDWRFSSGSLK